MITKEYLESQIQALESRRTEAQVHVHQCSGALAAYRSLLSKMSEESEDESSDAD